MEDKGFSALTGYLVGLRGFWDHWGFAPWQRGVFAGVSRVQRFVKYGFLGRTAKYHAWEAIVWMPGTREDRLALWKACGPMPRVMTQRFLFLLPDPWPERHIRSFFLGFRGYVEFYAYNPTPCENRDCAGHPKAQDLTGLVDLAVALQEDEQSPAPPPGKSGDVPTSRAGAPSLSS